MRRLIWLGILAALAVLPGFALAAGVCTQSGLETAILNGTGSEIVMTSVACTADVADGSFPDVTITSVGGNLIAVYVDYGTTAPTSGAYDITINASDVADADLLGGAGANLATGADGWISPLLGTVYAPAPFAGDLVVKQDGNAVNSANPTIFLFFSRK